MNKITTAKHVLVPKKQKKQNHLTYMKPFLHEVHWWLPCWHVWQRLSHCRHCCVAEKQQQ